MSSFSTATSVSRRLVSLCLLYIVLIVPVSLRAQQYVEIGNQYVGALITHDTANSYGGGRFLIKAGPHYNNVKFLYELTSNVVFRVGSSSGVRYYTNAKSGFGGAPLMPDGVTPVPYAPFDSLYTDSGQVAVVWDDLGGFAVTMRLIAENPASALDRGSDILIQFEYEALPNSGNVDLGVFLMLDTYNGHAEGSGGTGDKSAVMTDRGYFPTDAPGRLFQAPNDSIPTFYHVGNFLATPPVNTVLPIHRLIGTSHGGAPLTTPELFAVGSWRRFRFLSWEVVASDVTANVGDCATITRWSGLRGKGVVRTAYGMDDKDGNDLFHCRDANMFVDIRTPRIIEQTTLNGPFTADSFDLEMWVGNTVSQPFTVTITLHEPIGWRGTEGLLAVSPSTQAAQTVELPVHGVQRLRWRLYRTRKSDTVSGDVALDFRYKIAGGAFSTPVSFSDLCAPKIAVRPFKPAPSDTLPPVVIRMDRKGRPEYSVRAEIMDRHPGFIYDRGLEECDVRTSNVYLIAERPLSYCDTSKSVVYRVVQMDTSKVGYAEFTVVDCNGNRTVDSVMLQARPVDVWAPVIDKKIVRSGVAEFTIRDVHPNAFDSGIDTLMVLGAVNAELANMAPYVKCDTSSVLTFTIRVLDTTKSAWLEFKVLDCGGNSALDTFYYQPSTLGVHEGDDARGRFTVRSVSPQPARRGGLLEVYLGNLPASELEAEYVAADGRVVKRHVMREQRAGEEARVMVPVPEAAGAYLLRLRSAGRVAQAKIIVAP